MLCREGSISLLVVLVFPKNHVYLIDVHNLQASAFTTAGKEGKTLKSILESATISKVSVDIRNDSDALYSHFGIALQGIQDIQLMENASRSGHISGKRHLHSLAKCIETDAPLNPHKKHLWIAAKTRGTRLFDPTRGGSYQVFIIRPLREDIREYCMQDVQFLPHLRGVYWARLDQAWKRKVEKETHVRVLLSQSATYEPHGADKALGSW